MRASPPAQRKGTRSQKVAGNVGGGERFDLIIVGEGYSERIDPWRLLNGGVALSSTAQRRSGWAS